MVRRGREEVEQLAEVAELDVRERRRTTRVRISTPAVVGGVASHRFRALGTDVTRFATNPALVGAGHVQGVGLVRQELLQHMYLQKARHVIRVLVWAED